MFIFSLFSSFARWTSRATGHPVTFGVSFLVILGWALTGPVFGFSNTWQLVINTGTTIITFLVVFLIQNTQNRDSEAMHLKLDELIRATQGAHKAMLRLEDMTQVELDRVKAHYDAIARHAVEDLNLGRPDTGTPEY